MPRVERNQHAVRSVDKRQSKSKDRERSCTEKTKHKKQAKAARIAAKQNHDRPIRYNDVKAYDCRYCSGWHVGHDNRGRKEEKVVKLQVLQLQIEALFNFVPIGIGSKRTELFQFSLREIELKRVA